MDPFQVMNVVYDVQGDTLTRLNHLPCITAEAHNSLPGQTIFTQDFPLNIANKTSLRLYRPIVNPTPNNTKLPLILYIHGGGFYEYSASSTLFHDFCTNMSIQLPAVILSLDYRLAPECRLPAAYEDGVEALVWIQNQAARVDITDENLILKEIVDFSKCYILGISSGGNIAYHVGLRGLCLDLEPMVIKGYMFQEPFFSSEQRSESELQLGHETSAIPLTVCDAMWELALPKGCNRDHEYCNTVVGGSYKDKVRLLGKCLVTGRAGDLLVDYQKEFANMLKGNGVDVVRWFQEGYHAVELYEAEEAEAFFQVVKDFIFS